MEDLGLKFSVFVPIFVIAAVAVVVRYYVHTLTPNTKKTTIEQITNGHILSRSELLREHGKFIPRRAFLMRKHSFLNENNGYLRSMENVNPLNLVDPSQVVADVKRTYVENILLLLIGGFVRWKFSGSLTVKLPFPLLLKRFKELLQQDPDMRHLNSSWLSSSSWYVLCLSGFQPLLRLFLKKNESPEETFSVPIQTPYDSFNTFRQEREALEMCQHENRLANLHQELLK